MKCPFCEHIIRRKDEICNKCGERYPRVRITRCRFRCETCGSYKIKMEKRMKK